MPGLDATKPIGQAERPAAAEAVADGGPPNFTSAQVDRGRRAYLANCVDCHGDELNNGEFGGAPLTGAFFDDHWGGLTVDALFGYLSTAMPPNKPGGLSQQAYTDITTFILAKNGFQPRGGEMPADLDAMSTMVLER